MSYAKIRGKGFKTGIDMETGIDELIKAADLWCSRTISNV